MTPLETHPDGTVLLVQAQPKAGKNRFNGVHNGRLKIQVTQAPEKGKANRAIAKLLAKKLGIATSRVILLTGETSTHKRFLIEGVELTLVQLLL